MDFWKNLQSSESDYYGGALQELHAQLNLEKAVFMHLTGVFPLQCSGFAIFSDSRVQKAVTGHELRKVQFLPTNKLDQT